MEGLEYLLKVGAEVPVEGRGLEYLTGVSDQGELRVFVPGRLLTGPT